MAVAGSEVSPLPGPSSRLSDKPVWKSKQARDAPFVPFAILNPGPPINRVLARRRASPPSQPAQGASVGLSTASEESLEPAAAPGVGQAAAREPRSLPTRSSAMGPARPLLLPLLLLLLLDAGAWAREWNGGQVEPRVRGCNI